jgi:LPS export ABC transporter protein LptC
MKKHQIIIADFLSKVRNFFGPSCIAAIKLPLHRTLLRSDRYSTFLVPCALCLVLFFCSCENKQEDIDQWTRNINLREEATTVESYLSQGGDIKAKLTAPLMYRYQKDTVCTEFPNTLHVDFYGDSLQTESWLTAMYGIYYDNLNKVFLRDSVTVINIEGDTLRCPELWWDQAAGKFYTDKPARLDGPDKHLVGTRGLEATQDLRSIQFKFPIGPFNVKEGNTP